MIMQSARKLSPIVLPLETDGAPWIQPTFAGLRFESACSAFAAERAVAHWMTLRLQNFEKEAEAPNPFLVSWIRVCTKSHMVRIIEEEGLEKGSRWIVDLFRFLQEISFNSLILSRLGEKGARVFWVCDSTMDVQAHIIAEFVNFGNDFFGYFGIMTSVSEKLCDPN